MELEQIGMLLVMHQEIFERVQMKRFLIAFVAVLGISSITNGAEPDLRMRNATIQVESSGNDRAVGDKTLADKAYGPLQIRQPVCDDINTRYGTSYRAEQCFGDRELSIRIYNLYMGIYATEEHLGRKPTYEDMARIWNGGPAGCFENGAINKNGKLAKPKKLAKVIECQQNAKKYWLTKIKPALEHSKK